MSAVFTNPQGLTLRVEQWGDRAVAPASATETRAPSYAVRCHDDCRAEAWSLHCGPWDDLAEAERRAAAARPKKAVA